MDKMSPEARRLLRPAGFLTWFLAGLPLFGWLFETPTLILTTFDEDKFIIGGLRAAAKGYLLKDVSLDQLTRGIRTLASGGTLVHPALTQRLLNNIDIRCDFPSIETPERLTWRETEILRLVARGYNHREIGEALTIAEGTVKNYISGILLKMGVRTGRGLC
jgi:DNA-binding NarL/FixJ family response regulator